jgi:hypothetical protein
LLAIAVCILLEIKNRYLKPVPQNIAQNLFTKLVAARSLTAPAQEPERLPALVQLPALALLVLPRRPR